MDKRLEAKINKRLNDGIKNASTEMALDVQNAYESFITKFYKHYDPNSYNRTFSLYLASNGYDLDNVIKIAQETSLRAFSQIKVRVSSDNIAFDPYRADKEWVFTRAFESGIHGFTPDEYNDWTQRDNVNPIMLTGHIPPPPLSPSPKEMMDKWFKKYKKTNVKNIVTKNVVNSLKMGL